MQWRAPEGAPRLTVAAVGDVAVVGGARVRARTAGHDAVLAAIAPAMRAADLGFANLEMPIAPQEWVRPGRSREFWQDAEVAPALARAGVHVVSLANNHVMDAGPRGLERTLATCAAAGLATVGAGADLTQARAPARLERRGRRIAVLAYATPSPDAAAPARPGFAPLDPALVEQDVTRCRAEADIVIVSVHWGSMYVDDAPEPVRRLGRRLLGWGADLVIGTHPHVMQGWAGEGGGLVLFSLGDAVFDPAAGELPAGLVPAARRASAVFRVTLAERPGLTLEPLMLDDAGVPRAADAGEAGAIRDRLAPLAAAGFDGDPAAAARSARSLLRYELASALAWLKRGRLDRVARLIAGIRPRHVRLLWRGFVGLWSARA